MFVIAFAAGWIAIAQTWQNYKKFPVQYLLWFKWFIICLNILLFFDVFLIYFSANLREALQPDHWITVYFIFRGLIYTFLLFLYFCYYLFCRSFLKSSIFNKKQTVWIVAIFLVLISVTCFWVTNNITSQIIYLLDFLFIIFGRITGILITVKCFFIIHRETDPKIKQITNKIVFIFFIILVLNLMQFLFLIFSWIYQDFYNFISAFIYISLNILPIFYLKRFVHKFEPEAKAVLDLKFEKLCKKYKLSQKETKITRLICQGKINKEIADVLDIELQTVKGHNYRIYKKLGINSRFQLLKIFQDSY